MLCEHSWVSGGPSHPSEKASVFGMDHSISLLTQFQDTSPPINHPAGPRGDLPETTLGVLRSCSIVITGSPELRE